VADPAADLPARITAAARDVGDSRAAYHLAIQSRDALMVTALDEGYSERSIASFAGIDRATLRAAIGRAEAAAA
jgi:hypothetical protein